MLDLDDFKSFNDRHGHLAGDSLLIGVSQSIRGAVRNIDVVSRFGGEEFAILSPQTSTAEAMVVAERVRRAVQDRPVLRKKREPLGRVSLSAGVATYPDQAGSLQELLDNADRALYRAKDAGKNQVVLYSPP
jgi:diguanylate cyclase (GGDEF)-like protein